ncbi:MAG: exodeoxyribonuclease VII large subunit [Campylobacteraceae bacterium]|jgi:exodeoxyribonuclease VII large subunit|nr:exodeoxyribonuclease VII large subunit [Campylobacteraceae bacterium]
MLTSVTELNRQIEALLESTFLHVRVEGEVSRPTYHASGHVYFTLKDNESTILCVMFKGNVKELKFELEDGLKVVVNGSISVYVPRGSYQINCLHVEPSGVGALAKAYEQLKAKLEKKGYFENKKPIPRFPSCIAVVTSATGAAWQDMLKVASKRWPLTKLVLIPSLVQGESAAVSIAQAIKKADMLECDVMVIGRGGGSMEDLWAFNEEIVADAVYHAKTPIVSAVGHEIDYVISDFVADARAPTPSAAMEMILPQQDELKQTIDYMRARFVEKIKKMILQKEQILTHLSELYKKNSFDAKIKFQLLEATALKNSMNAVFYNSLLQRGQNIKELFLHFESKSAQILNKNENILKSFQNTYALQEPTQQSRDGFAQIVKNAQKMPLEEINEGDEFELQTPKTKLFAKALKKQTFASHQSDISPSR